MFLMQEVNHFSSRLCASKLQAAHSPKLIFLGKKDVRDHVSPSRRDEALGSAPAQDDLNAILGLTCD